MRTAYNLTKYAFHLVKVSSLYYCGGEKSLSLLHCIFHQQILHYVVKRKLPYGFGFIGVTNCYEHGRLILF